MKWNIYISVILLLSNIQGVIAQHIDLPHNNFRIGDKNQKECVSISTTDNNGKTLWKVHPISNNDDICQKIFFAPNSTYDVSYSELSQLHHFSIDNGSLLLMRSENNQMSIDYDLSEIVIPQSFSYGDCISGLFHGTGTYCDKLRVLTCGQYSLSADALGDLLTLENDTIHNVMRISTTRLRYTEFMPFNIQPSVYGIFTNDSIRMCLAKDSMTVEENYCRWYANGYRYPILEQYKIFNGNNIICDYILYNSADKQELLDTDEVNIELRNTLNTRPITEKLIDNDGETSKHINYQCGMNGSNIIIDFSLRDDNDVSFILCNSQGITFKSLNSHYSSSETYHVNIDCGGLPRGQYVLYIIVAGEQSIEKFNIK